jgi:hypothetical protein
MLSAVAPLQGKFRELRDGASNEVVIGGADASAPVVWIPVPARQGGPNRTARAQRPPSSITHKSIARSRSATTGPGVILIPNAQLAAAKATIREVISQILKNTCASEVGCRDASIP